jgi:hypothetical protein
MIVVHGTAQEKSWISVRSDSGSFDVYVDTVMIGKSSLDSISITPGTHVLRFVQPETRSWYQVPVVETVTVVAGEHLKRTIEKSRTLNPPSSFLIQPREKFLNDSGSVVPARALANGLPSNNLPLYLTSSAAVVSGAVAAYFKIKADNLYDEFERTGDNSALDDVKTYDTVSGIALGVCEINLGLLTYLLLSK